MKEKVAIVDAIVPSLPELRANFFGNKWRYGALLLDFYISLVFLFIDVIDYRK